MNQICFAAAVFLGLASAGWGQGAYDRQPYEQARREFERLDRNADFDLWFARAESYARAAAADGRHDEARQVWRNAARRADRSGTDTARQARYWYETAAAEREGRHARRALGAVRTAARRLGDTADLSGAEAGLAAEIHTLHASLLARHRRPSQAHEPAATALAVLGRLDAPISETYARAHYYAGIALMQVDTVEASYHLHLAAIMIEQLQPGSPLADQTAQVRLAVAGDLSDEEEQRAITLIQSDPVYFGYFAAGEREGPALGMWPDRYAACPRAIHYVEPRLPRRVFYDVMSGILVARFDLSDDGRTENIEVLNAFPVGYLENAARAAIRNWRYPSVSESPDEACRRDIITVFTYFTEAH